MLNDMLNTHDKHLTKINLNKFSLWICPLFKEKFKSVLKKKKKKTKTCKEKSDLFLKSVNKKKDLSRKLDVYCEREKEWDFF